MLSITNRGKQKLYELNRHVVDEILEHKRLQSSYRITSFFIIVVLFNFAAKAAFCVNGKSETTRIKPDKTRDPKQTQDRLW